jgi:hypothetical protein
MYHELIIIFIYILLNLGKSIVYGFYLEHRMVSKWCNLSYEYFTNCYL